MMMCIQAKSSSPFIFEKSRFVKCCSHWRTRIWYLIITERAWMRNFEIRTFLWEFLHPRKCESNMCKLKYRDIFLYFFSHINHRWYQCSTSQLNTDSWPGYIINNASGDDSSSSPLTVWRRAVIPKTIWWFSTDYPSHDHIQWRTTSLDAGENDSG